jgi:hypothetical protein
VVPYSQEVLNAVVQEYQQLFFPLQLFFIFLALLSLYALWKQTPRCGQLISGVLALFFLWSGGVYFGNYYETINWFGLYAGMVFCLQGVILLWYGVLKKMLLFEQTPLSLGLAWSVLALLPMVQVQMGATYYEVYVVGMLPLATLAFFTSLALALQPKKALHVSLIPLVWSVFSLYWNALLGNQLALFLSGFCLIGAAWAMLSGLRKNQQHNTRIH